MLKEVLPLELIVINTELNFSKHFQMIFVIMKKMRVILLVNVKDFTVCNFKMKLNPQNEDLTLNIYTCKKKF